jgi:hypothetical protein
MGVIMKTLMTLVTTVGLLAGGIGLSQYIGNRDQYDIQNSALRDLPAVAYKLTGTLITGLGNAKPGSQQITQAEAEANTQLQLIQIRQNAEIIRLLTVLANNR